MTREGVVDRMTTSDQHTTKLLQYLERRDEWRRLNRLGVRCAPPPKPRYLTSPAAERAEHIDHALTPGASFVRYFDLDSTGIRVK
jgi:hypothetical protein